MTTKSKLSDLSCFTYPTITTFGKLGTVLIKLSEVKLARGDKVKSRFQEEIDLLNSKIQGYNEERLEA